MPSKAMIALYPPEDICEALALPGGEAKEELHLTLLFLGDAEMFTLGQVKRIDAIASSLAATYQPLSMAISGVGKFAAVDSEEPFYASVDALSLSSLRSDLAAALKANDVSFPTEHGLTPHITLAYLPANTPAPRVSLPTATFAVRSLSVVVGEYRQDYPFTGELVTRIEEGTPTPVLVPSVGRPFGEFSNMDDCIAQVKEKGVIDPAAYCAAMHKEITGKYPSEASETEERSAPETEDFVGLLEEDFLTERYHDAFTLAIKEYLKKKVSSQEFDTAVRYARAKAGGIAAAEKKKKNAMKKRNSNAIAKLIMGVPVTELSSKELLTILPEVT